MAEVLTRNGLVIFGTLFDDNIAFESIKDIDKQRNEYNN